MPDRYEWEAIGTVTLSGQGQITVPKLARDGSGLTENTRAMVYVEPTLGLVLLSHAPLADDLIDLAADAAKKKRGS